MAKTAVAALLLDGLMAGTLQAILETVEKLRNVTRDLLDGLARREAGVNRDS